MYCDFYSYLIMSLILFSIVKLNPNFRCLYYTFLTNIFTENVHDKLLINFNSN